MGRFGHLPSVKLKALVRGALPPVLVVGWFGACGGRSDLNVFPSQTMRPRGVARGRVGEEIGATGGTPGSGGGGFGGSFGGATGSGPFGGAGGKAGCWGRVGG